MIDVLDRFRKAADLHHCVAEILPGVGIIGFYSQCTLEARDGLLKSVGTGKGDAQVIKRIIIIWIYSYGRLKLIDRIWQLICAKMQDAEIVVGQAILRLIVQHLAPQNCFIVVRGEPLCSNERKYKSNQADQ